MKSRGRRKSVSLPFLLTNLTLASWETIGRRTMMAAQNQCSLAEYQRMIHEKALAAAESGMRLLQSGGRASMSSLLAPWYKRAAANAKRLRTKRGKK
jgi:hypothetical protein